MFRHSFGLASWKSGVSAGHPAQQRFWLGLVGAHRRSPVRVPVLGFAANGVPSRFFGSECCSASSAPPSPSPSPSAAGTQPAQPRSPERVVSSDSASAPSSPASGTRRRLNLSQVPHFKTFVLRREVLNLYRKVLRTSQRLDPVQRREVRSFARHEFELMRRVDDADQIKYLLANGKRQLEQLEQMAMMAL